MQKEKQKPRHSFKNRLKKQKNKQVLNNQLFYKSYKRKRLKDKKLNQNYF